MLVNFAQAGPMSESPRLSEILVSILYFVLSVSGAIAVLMIVIAGVIYMTSGGDEQRVARAKLGLTVGVIGIVIILLSLVIISTIVRVV